MAYTERVYEIIHKADEWIEFEEIAEELEETYSTVNYMTLREDLMELQDLKMIEKKDKELVYRVKK